MFLGLANGNFGSVLPGWKDYGSISAIDVDTGKRVWKFDTPEPERGGVTTTDGGVGFAGGGDGVLRAFDAKTGKVLWTFQTGAPDRGGPVGVLGQRHRVRRDHCRRHADVVERRHGRASCRCSRSAARRPVAALRSAARRAAAAALGRSRAAGAARNARRAAGVCTHRDARAA